MRRRIIRFFIWLVTLALVAVSGGLLAGCGDPTPQPSQSPEKIVARVNGSPITSGDVERAKDAALLSGSALNDEQALRQVIGEELVRQEAERLGVSVTKAQVETRVEEVAAAAGGLKELKAQLAAAGVNMDELSASVESVLTGEQLEASKYADLSASRAEARAFYAENTELFSTPATVRLGDIAVRRKGIAETAIARIEAGQPFDNASRQFSVDPELKAKSGILGWVTISSLPAPARTAVARLQVGEMTAPVRVGPLWHVFKLFGRRAAATQPFADVAQLIETELTRRLRSEALAEWVESERKSADIEQVQ